MLPLCPGHFRHRVRHTARVSVHAPPREMHTGDNEKFAFEFAWRDDEASPYIKDANVKAFQVSVFFPRCESDELDRGNTQKVIKDVIY